jgi:diguanylate cyclase (GGDEF)-like protein/PAS domain S-box-containing protein
MSIRVGWSGFHTLIVIAGGVICTAGLAIGLTIWWLRSDAIDAAYRDNSNLAAVLGDQISNSVHSIDLVLDEVKTALEARGQRAPGDFDRILRDNSTHQYILERLSHLPQAVLIGLADRNGRLANTTQQWPTPSIDVSDSAHFQHFKRIDDNGIYISNAQIERIRKEKVIFFSRRIDGADKTFLGVVVVGVKLTYFQHIYESLASMRGLAVLFLHRNGVPIVRYPDEKTRMYERVPADSPWRRLVLQGGGQYRSSGYFDHEARLVVVHPLRDYPLVVNVAVLEAAALATWHFQAIMIGAGTLLVMFFSGFLLRALSKQFRLLATSETALLKKSQELAQANATLDVALNNMAQGLLMFDAAGQIIVANDRYRQLYNLPSDLVKPGCAILDLLKWRAAKGTYSGDPDEYVRNLLATIARGKTATLEVATGDGRIVSIVNQPMAGGGWVATHEDITEAKRQADSFRLLFESNPVPMYVNDAGNMRFLAVNDAAVAHYGYSREQFLAMTAFDIRPTEERERLAKFILEPYTQRGQQIWQHWKSNGTKIDVAIYSKLMTYEGREAFFVAAIDVTQSKRAAEKLRHMHAFLNTVIENVPIPIVVRDAREDRYTLANRATETLYGVSRNEIIGKNPHELYSKEQADFIVARDKEALRSDQPLIIESHSVHTPHNGLRVVTSKRVVIHDESGKPEYLLGVLEDVTEQKLAEQRIAYLAHYDALTGLANRVLFCEQLEQALKRVRHGERLAVLYIDLDHLKRINDTLGHSAGDELLKGVADRLRGCVKDIDVLARLSGDEFAVIQMSFDRPADAAELAVRARDAIQEPFELDGHQVIVDISVGISVAPNDATERDELLKTADIALYEAKNSGRGTYCFYEKDMHERMRARDTLERDLQSALANGEFELFYQPVVALKENSIKSFEALLRWRHPTRGLVSPGEFIGVAEETGLIVPLGEWVLRHSCAEAASWPDDIGVAVNVSSVQLTNKNLANAVIGAIAAAGITPDRLILEITESVFLKNTFANLATLKRLHELGVRFAMDDFGTGYSSLGYLLSFPFSKIKIDRSFITDLTDRKESRAIVRAITDLGRSLKMRVIAEGVETAQQLEQLRILGCAEIQGYLFSPPRPASEIRQYFMPNRRETARIVRQVA